ncbi:MAG: hypothetical protein GF307_05380 [candidate division Zixibacteria bacterium]|nr:hypothetical protein [candidate division Zixibacteria bacterium]
MIKNRFTLIVLLIVCFGISMPAGSQPLQQFSSEGYIVLTADRFDEFKLTSPQNLSGSVTAKSVSGNKVEMSIEYRGKAENRDIYDWLQGLVEINSSSADRVAEIDISTPDNAPWEGLDKSISVNLKIDIPETARLGLDGQFYSITVEGPFPGLDIENEYGDIAVREINGDVNITAGYKKVELREIQGEVNVFSNSGSITARDINCGNSKCRFETTQGGIELRSIEGEIEAVTSYKPIEIVDCDAGLGVIYAVNNYAPIIINNVSGVLDLTTNYGKINVNDGTLPPGRSKISTNYEPIELRGVTMDESFLTVNNIYSDIRIWFAETPAARVFLATDEGGTIHTVGLPIKATALTRNRFEGFIGGARSSVEANIQGIGKIELRGAD